MTIASEYHTLDARYVGAGWLMTSLSPTPVMVALVQTATTLPILFPCASRRARSLTLSIDGGICWLFNCGWQQSRHSSAS
ncbi:MAG: MFS transporter [Candidatus Competibacteraceae bacterium]